MSPVEQLEIDYNFVKNQKDIYDIAAPLFKYLKLDYFHFRRTFNDGSFLVLASNNDWPAYFVKNNIPITTPISQEHYDINRYFCLWEGNIPESTLADAKNYFGIRNALAVVEKNDNYFDSFSFANNTETYHAKDYYLNHIESLLKFIPFFKEQAAKLIKEAEKSPITRPTNLQDANLDKILRLKFDDTNKEAFFRAIGVAKEFRSKNHNLTEILTKREIECIKYLSHSMSRKEIAKKLGLSPRTIDTHLEKARIKLGYFTNKELINLWWANQY